MTETMPQANAEPLFKLIVKNPAGQLEEIQIAEGGRYFDPAAVLWDERDGKAITAEQAAALDAWRLELRKVETRAQRNALLRANVDTLSAMRWDAMAPEKKTAWQAYRQALLDVPQQPGFPDAVAWPPVPEGR